MKLPDDIEATRAPKRDTASSIAFDVTRVETVHLCPPRGSGLMPCCGRTPFEVPRYHRMTLDGALVTCHTRLRAQIEQAFAGIRCALIHWQAEGVTAGVSCANCQSWAKSIAMPFFNTWSQVTEASQERDPAVMQSWRESGPDSARWEYEPCARQHEPGRVCILPDGHDRPTEASQGEVGRPVSDGSSPAYGTEDYRRWAVLFNDISYAPRARLLFSERRALTEHLWAQGWRRDVRPEDVTEDRS